MPRVLCIGDVMLDVIAEISVAPQLINFGSDTATRITTHGGGAGGNVASWLTIVGCQSHIVARVGNDPAGTALVAEFDALGVTHGNLYHENLDTGVIVILLDPSGERTMLAGAGANSHLQLSDLPELDIFDAVYLTGYALLNPISREVALAMIRKISATGLPIYFDPATVGGMSVVDSSEILSWLPNMQTIILNEEEAAFLTGETQLAAALNSLLTHCHGAVIKRGALGAIAKFRDSEIYAVPATETCVVDTTGAGDSFAAGFIASLLVGADLPTALLSGTQIAARCVAIVGARPPFGGAL